MIILKLFLFAGTSVLWWHGVCGADKLEPESHQVDCSDAINHYRHLAHLHGLQHQSMLSLPSSTREAAQKQAPAQPAILQSVCDSLQPGVNRLATAFGADDGVYVVHRQSGDQADCHAAVKSWIQGIAFSRSAFPAFDDGKEYYKDVNTMAFAALFHPKFEAKVDCAYVTCPPKALPIGEKRSRIIRLEDLLDDTAMSTAEEGDVAHGHGDRDPSSGLSKLKEEEEQSDTQPESRDPEGEMIVQSSMETGEEAMTPSSPALVCLVKPGATREDSPSLNESTYTRIVRKVKSFPKDYGIVSCWVD